MRPLTLPVRCTLIERGLHDQEYVSSMYSFADTIFVPFSYNSQTVDGRTAVASPQSSWIGEGWD